ncbi:hypothetical protein SAMN05443377_10726 [Propionibacterium cyclohexanicum]|uniref:Uncharacterized protein n=1 Tax=Propionibacterium cyclohexanicum TaxID=64702 RepID=A0A1H9RFI3_9ACTN|nr:hypothetical protein [Propionibacterium cyclohexanicum]SER71424.1 hypothetical protein SAMN05443377_10726 [Propionibacterium cyclohexanicum]
MPPRNPFRRSSPGRASARPITISRVTRLLLVTVWIWFIAAPLFAILMFAIGKWPIGFLFAVITPFSWWTLPVARRQYRAWPRRSVDAPSAQLGDALALTEGLVTDGFRAIAPRDCRITVALVDSGGTRSYFVRCVGGGETIEARVPTEAGPQTVAFLRAAQAAGAQTPEALPRQ